MEDSKVCPFSTLKSSNLKKSSNSRNVNNSNKTPCPIVNVLINKGVLNPTREWTREEIRNVLKKNKLTSNIFSNLFNQYKIQLNFVKGSQVQASLTI